MMPADDTRRAAAETELVRALHLAVFALEAPSHPGGARREAARHLRLALSDVERGLPRRVAELVRWGLEVAGELLGNVEPVLRAALAGYEDAHRACP
jgi:hypothetical protein